MVRKFFERISAPVRGLHQAAYLLAILTLASQLLALLRDRTFAHYFGVGQVLDLYYAAFRIPDLILLLVCSVVSAYILIPRITGMGRDEVERLLSEAASFLFIVCGAISAVIAVYMPSFLALLYPDLVAADTDGSFIFLARLLLLQPILLGLSGVLGSLAQVHRRFTLFALSPVLYNTGIIFGTLALYPSFGIVGIGLGVILGCVAHILVNIPVLLEAGIVPRLTLPRPSSIWSLMKDSVPRSLALSTGALTLLLMTALASRLGTGSVSLLTFASNLEAVPLALIGSSYAVAAFPALSEAARGEKRQEFTQILSDSARHIILWSVVALGLIIVLRAHLVRVILGSGAFDWSATRLTAALLAILVVGLLAQGLVLLFSRALYAIKRSWQPLIYHLLAGAVTVGGALLLLGVPRASEWVGELLRVGDLPGTEILLIAIAISAGQIFLALCCLLALNKEAPGLARTLLRPFTEGVIAMVVGGFVTYVLLSIEGTIAPLTTLLNVFIEGFIAGMGGLAAAALTLYALGNGEIRMIVAAIGKLIRTGAEWIRLLPPSAEEPPPQQT